MNVVPLNSSEAASSPPPPGPSSIRLLPWLVAVAFFMESLDTTILNTAVPAISEALKVSPLSMKSVLASYTLSLAVFIPISGWMADRFGTRRVFAAAIGLFTLGSFLCGISSNIHLLVACRILQGCGGAMMVPVGRLTLVRTFAKSELIRVMSFVAIPALIGPMLGPIAGGLIVGYLHWRFIFFVNIPIGFAGLLMVYLHLPDYRERTNPLDVVGLILFGSGVALLSYVLEVFGDHALSMREILGLLTVSVSLIAGYELHAREIAFPLLQLSLFRIRTFSAAVSGSFFTRLGIGGVPFLLPLLYQVGLGFTPVQSGLLIMPQAIAAMSTKFLLPRVLARIGYRGVLISNTVMLGLLLLAFATIGLHTPVWTIVLLAFVYGAFTSLQYTSMNTLVYADITDEETSNASSIASTMQQMSMSFGVASAGLATAFFIPGHAHSNPVELIHGIHEAFVALGGFTVLSTIIFHKLKRGDGGNVSQQKVLHAE
jgi:EmrB/QacA subfamily drug resistance transporter